MELLPLSSSSPAPPSTLRARLHLAEPKGDSTSYILPSLPYLRLRFTLVAEEAARLPAYLGSLLRGAFGHALRRLVCTMGPQQACVSCPLRGACAYTQVFETFVDGEPPPFLHGLPTSPRPFVIEPRSEGGVFALGAELSFDLLLFGRAAALQAFVVVAVERMGERGLGVNRHPFRLARVEHETADGRFMELPRQAGAAHWPAAPARALPSTPLPPGPLRLRFLTPTRLAKEGELLPRVSVRQLVFRMIRRHLELAHFFDEPASVDWTFAPLLRSANAVHVVESRLTWHDWERYSNRQQTKMKLGGFVGDLVLAGDLAPLTPLLRSAEVLHVGKSATFGLGNMVIETA